MNARIILLLAMAGAVFATAPALAQTKPGAPAAQPAAPAPSPPAQSSLIVGALQIGSTAALEVAGIDINVSADGVVYSYYFKNNGSAEMRLTAALALPSLQASADGSETWVLASNDPENPIGLTVTAGGTAVSTQADVRASALGVDRLAVLKSEHLPLIPFGPDADKAMASLSPETADRLAAMGLVSPRDPAKPKEPVIPDWSLDVVRTWQQTLPPGKTTPVVIKFTPVKAQYTITKDDLDDLNDLSDDLCLKPPVLTTLQSRLKGGGAWKIMDMSLADDAPARWVDSPNATLSVQKPKPDAIVTFCGLEEKTAGKPTVLGTAPDDNDGIRILIFEPAGK
jgi:hypothetical protein